MYFILCFTDMNTRLLSLGLIIVPAARQKCWIQECLVNSYMPIKMEELAVPWTR